MALATLTSKGQLTLPKAIREHLHVDTGDKLEFVVSDEGDVMVVARTVDLKDLFGMVKRRKHVTVEDMDKAIAKAVTKKWKRHESD